MTSILIGFIGVPPALPSMVGSLTDGYDALVTNQPISLPTASPHPPFGLPSLTPHPPTSSTPAPDLQQRTPGHPLKLMPGRHVAWFSRLTSDRSLIASLPVQLWRSVTGLLRRIWALPPFAFKVQ